MVGTIANISLGYIISGCIIELICYNIFVRHKNTNIAIICANLIIMGLFWPIKIHTLAVAVRDVNDYPLKQVACNFG